MRPEAKRAFRTEPEKRIAYRTEPDERSAYRTEPVKECLPDGTSKERVLYRTEPVKRAIGYQMALVEQRYWLPDRTGRTELLVTGQNR